MTPPNSIQAERSILGALLLYPEQYETVSETVSASHFYSHAHQLIYTAIESCVDQNKTPDAVTVSEQLESKASLNDAGGIQYLVELAESSVSTSNVDDYAKIIRDKYQLRTLLSSCHDIAQSVHNPDGRSANDIIDGAEAKILSIGDQASKAVTGPVPMSVTVDATMMRMDELGQSGTPPGLPTGFADLNKILSGGLQDSDLIVVAGRPAQGKTTLVMNMVQYISLVVSQPCVFFSMEMPAQQLTMRVISSLSKVPLGKVRSGNMSNEEWARAVAAQTAIKNGAPLFIDDTPALTPADVRARCRRLHRDTGGLGLVAIDYLQLMRFHGAERKDIEIGEITRSMKALAKELDCPVVLLSQLNRSLEQRPDKRPLMSDLKESGSIEADSDVIAFVYRDEVYNEDSPDKGTAEILVRKHRNGETGMVRLTFQGQYTLFSNFAQTQEYQSYGT